MIDAGIGMEVFITNCLLFIAVLLGPLLLLSLIVLFTAQAFIALKHKAIRIYRLRSTPCGQCLYHTGCKELACTVQPCLALTKAANDCQDFTPTNRPRHPGLDYYKL